MQLFVKKIFLFFILVFVMDLFFGLILKGLYFNVPQKLTYSIRESNEDVLIYGSSRANRHYNPKVFEDKLGLSCFNNGFDGRNIFYHYALFQSAIKRSKPKLVILDIMASDYTITSSDWDTDRLNVLLPFFNENEYINDVVNLRSPFEKVKLFSSIYPFNSALVEIYKNYLYNKDPSMGYMGFIPKKKEDGFKRGMSEVQFNQDGKPDARKINYLQKIIQVCKNNNIPLIVVISPWFSSKIQESKILEKITSDNQIPLWNFSHSESFNDELLFFDASHLNDIGANLFSEFIAHKIQKEIIKDE